MSARDMADFASMAGEEDTMSPFRVSAASNGTSPTPSPRAALAAVASSDSAAVTSPGQDFFEAVDSIYLFRRVLTCIHCLRKSNELNILFRMIHTRLAKKKFVPWARWSKTGEPGRRLLHA